MRIWKLATGNEGGLGEAVLCIALCTALCTLLLAQGIPLAAGQPMELAQVRGPVSGGFGVWDAQSFGWFFYNPDEDVGGEHLEVLPDGRVVDEGNLVYTSTIWSRTFEQEEMGRYYAVAFLGKRYLAGYPESDFTDEVSALENGELREMVVDRDAVLTLTTEKPLALGDGYLLALEGVSKEGDVAYFKLSKGDDAVYDAVVQVGETMAYKVGDDELPVILVHVSGAMQGSDLSFVEVDGIFQVRDVPSIVLVQGQRIDKLEVTDISDGSLEMKNYDDVTLNTDSLVRLAGGLFLRVTDDPDLQYYPLGVYDEYGLYPIRGQTFPLGRPIPHLILADERLPTFLEAIWNSRTFTDFYYDDDKNIGTETLVLNGTVNRVIPPFMIAPREDSPILDLRGLLYYSAVQTVEFEKEEWGSYKVLPLFGQLWFAGYGNETSPEIGDVSPMEYELLAKVLVDTDQTDIAVAEDIYFFQEGYSLIIRDVGKEKIFIHLMKNGELVDNSTVEANSTYVYEVDLGGHGDLPLVEDLPVIALHVGEIFQNDEDKIQVAVIDGLFQLSDQIYVPVDFGREYGEMGIVGLTGDYIILGNQDSLTLKRDSYVSLWPEISGMWRGVNLASPDNDTLRYFPYTLEYVIPSPEVVGLVGPTEAVPPSGLVNFSVNVKAAELKSVVGEILDPQGRLVTNADLLASGVPYPERVDLWTYPLQWKASISVLSDDGSHVPDIKMELPTAVLYLDDSGKALPVVVRFDGSGKMTLISDLEGKSYYVSRSAYGEGYDQMLNDTAIRDKNVLVVPGVSKIAFYNFVDGQAIDASNHTLTGEIGSLEPHLIRIPAPPGRYELNMRITNVMNTLRVRGVYFNVSGSQSLDARGIQLGSVLAALGEEVQVGLATGPAEGEKRVVIGYDPGLVKARGAEGAGSKIDSKEGKMSLTIPGDIESVNLTFVAGRNNGTSELKVIEYGGFEPAVIVNGSITVSAVEESSPEKSDAAGVFLSFLALALASRFGRWRPRLR